MPGAVGDLADEFAKGSQGFDDATNQMAQIAAGRGLQALQMFNQMQPGLPPGAGPMPTTPTAPPMGGAPGMGPPPPQAPPMPQGANARLMGQGQVAYNPQPGAAPGSFASRFPQTGQGVLPNPGQAQAPPQAAPPPPPQQPPQQQMPPMPQGGMPGYPGAYSLPQIVQAVQRANPGAPPAVLFKAVAGLVPLMRPADQEYWKMIAAANATERTRQGQERIDLMGGGGQGGTAQGDPTLAKAIASYQMAPLPMGWRNPINRATMDMVYEMNPEYDVNQFYSKKAGETATGRAEALTKPEGDSGATPQSKMRAEQMWAGNTGPPQTARSMNVLTQHLGLLREVGTALQNGDNQTLNRIRQVFGQEFGSPLPTNFEAVRDIVSDEMVKAVTGGAGAVFDRDEVRTRLSKANTPEQLNQAIQYYVGLMRGQFNGLQQQYKSATGRDDFEHRFISPATSAMLKSGAGTQGGKIDREAAKKAGYTDQEIDEFEKGQ